jgi:multidrug efflux pump subunit AcrB
MINLSEIAVRERAVTLFAIIIVVVIGTLAFFEIGRAEDPNFTVKTMVVTAVWPGATAEEMTNQVADKLEKRIQSVPNFDNVQTYNRPGLSILEITLKDTTPPAAVPDAWYQVRKKVSDERDNLPRGVAALNFNDEFSDVYFAEFALQAPGMPERELVRRAETIRERYLAVDGVQKADIIGEQRERLFVEFDYARLATLGITTQQLFDALSKANAVTPGGSIETKAERIYVRLDAATATEASIADIPVAAGGRMVRLGDIATVKRGYEDPPSFLVRYNGKPTIVVGVVMRRDFNGAVLGSSLKTLTSQIKAELPLGITINQTADQAINIATATNEFGLKFVVALTTVMIVSFIALGFRTGLVVATAVPLTIAITFVIMAMTSRNFDRITLGALILSLGLLVDDAIISIEMMVVKMEEGLDRVKAATFAWTATAAPMLSGTLVTIVAFIPVGFAHSSAGEYAGNIFWITACALITSWFVAVVFTPFIGVLILPDIKQKEGGHDAIYATPRYEKLRSIIRRCVDGRRLVLIVTAAAFVIATLGMVFLVRKQFFPSSDRPELLVEVYMPQGTSVAQTLAAAERAEAIVAKAPETMFYSTYVGAGPPRFFLAANPELPDPAFAKLVVQTKDEKAREALKRRVDAAVSAGAVPGARVRTNQLLLGPPVPFPVSFRVRGPQIDGVKKVAESVLTIARSVPEAAAMHVEWGERASTMHLKIDQARLRQLGLTPQDVASQVDTLLGGATIAQAREDIRTVDIVARANGADRSDLSRLANVPITNAQGQSIALGQIATLEPRFEDPLIKRYNRQISIDVRGDTAPGIQPSQATSAIDAKLAGLRKTLPPGYSVEIGGTEEQNAKANTAIASLIPVMLILMLSFIMLQVRSFPVMLMTLLTGPLGLIGAVASLLAFNAPFGFTAILGLLGLAGILMRNTLILVQQIQENHAEEHRSLYDAVIEATVHRARPVILTALAGMLAFLPLTITALWGPMAIVLIGGLGAGTVLTLLFVPALYAFWFKIEKPDADARSPGAHA